MNAAISILRFCWAERLCACFIGMCVSGSNLLFNQALDAQFEVNTGMNQVKSSYSGVKSGQDAPVSIGSKAEGC